ncbi:MAG: hypothetical protein VXV96_05920 [Bdellovibrionota bacterium]|jgi:hypothetical protein|nr:hypothetical protein [Bdellovibrionota bacterium]
MNSELWQPIENISKPQVFNQLDYAVREQVKGHITRHLHVHMDKFIQHGLTYEQLLKMQEELDLCPSVLKLYPREDSSSLRAVIERFWKRLF